MQHILPYIYLWHLYVSCQSLVYELIESGVYDRDEDFTVVLQPVFEDLVFDVPEVKYVELNVLLTRIIGRWGPKFVNTTSNRLLFQSNLVKY